MKPSLFDMVAIKEQIENDLDRKVDTIREHKNIKPIFLKMIQKDLIFLTTLIFILHLFYFKFD